MCNECCKSLAVVKTDKILKTKEIKLHVGVGNKKETFGFHKGLLTKVSKHFAETIKDDTTDIELKKEDPELIDMIHRWVYCDFIEDAPAHIPLDPAKPMPSHAEIQALEADLLTRFNKQQMKLVDLYCLAEKWRMEDLMNRAIDKIQDAYQNYGAVFGPGLVARIFENTKTGSQLRDLCIAANVIHMDRGCDQLRKEIMMNVFMIPEYLPAMLKWISRNFVMFGHRQQQGFDVNKREKGFSMLNHKSLCPCHFHIHSTLSRAHKDHKKCAVPFLQCGHGENDLNTTEGLAETAMLSALMNRMGTQ